jgi:hypothetical protein
MLGYFAAMRAADEDRDVFGVSVSDLSLSRSSAGGNRLRDDINNSNNTGNNPFNNQADSPADALLAAAPEREGRFLVVPTFSDQREFRYVAHRQTDGFPRILARGNQRSGHFLIR